MRVLLVTGEYPPMQGGVGDYTALLTEALRVKGQDVGIITSHRAASRPMTTREDSSLYPVMRSWGTRCWSKILDLAAEFGAQIVHVQYQIASFGMNPAISLLPAYARLRGAGRPVVVVTFHDLKPPYLFPKAGPVRGWPVLALARWSDGVIVTNQEDAAALLNKPFVNLNRRATDTFDRLWLIPIGSNIPLLSDVPEASHEWRNRLGIGPSTFLISYFGFLNRNKGVDLLLDAVSKVNRRGRSVHLLMIGGTAGDSDATNRAYADKIRAIVDSSDLRRWVSWTGFTGKDEVSLNLSQTDACVLPFREGGSYRHGTLVAALSHGLPVITTVLMPTPAAVHGPGALPPLRHGKNCLLVPSGDANALAEAIEALASTSELRQEIAFGARELASHFSWDRIAERTVQLYEGLLARGARTPR